VNVSPVYLLDKAALAPLETDVDQNVAPRKDKIKTMEQYKKKRTRRAGRRSPSNNVLFSSTSPTTFFWFSLSLRCLGSALLTPLTTTSWSRTVAVHQRPHKLRSIDMDMTPPSDWQDENDNDPNRWMSSDDSFNGEESINWKEVVESKADGSFWSSFYPSADDDELLMGQNEVPVVSSGEDLDDEADVWLNTLASISAEEVQYNIKEADRADKVRQMQEWGFDSETIKNTFDVAVDDSLETKDEVAGMKEYRKILYLDDEDWKKVESHTKVEKDLETGEPVRQQMVYVDEHTCIGCTNCAMIAQSTFFMDDEHGRARVFQQWGDDEDTIAVAIQTCPVDCIHYVPYDELVKLEVERRGQNINFKARLVSQAEYGGVGSSHMVGSAAGFTAPQLISGNMGSRCNNCPSRGCWTCPMYGVGKNPEYERKEKERKAKIERNRLRRLREEERKSADL
jgi:ferredoxin